MFEREGVTAASMPLHTRRFAGAVTLEKPAPLPAIVRQV